MIKCAGRVLERKGRLLVRGQTREVIKMEERGSKIWKMWEKGQKGTEMQHLPVPSTGPAASHISYGSVL